MLGEKWMLKKLLARPPQHDTRFLPYATQLRDRLDRGVNLGIDPFAEENERLKILKGKMKCEEEQLEKDRQKILKETGKDIGVRHYTPTVQLDWSMQACPLDIGNPAWYERDPRRTFKHRGASSK